MHDRSVIWITKKGEELPISVMSSSHLSNVLRHIDDHPNWEIVYGRKHLNYLIKNIKAEIRYRKIKKLWKKH